MNTPKITLTPLTADDRNQFILDNQYAFKYGAVEEFGPRDNHIDDDGEIIILKVEEEKNGDTYLCPIEDAKEFDEIQSIFEERLADLFEEEE